MAIEPDYGGLIECPDEIVTVDLWQKVFDEPVPSRIGPSLPHLSPPPVLRSASTCLIA